MWGVPSPKTTVGHFWGSVAHLLCVGEVPRGSVLVDGRVAGVEDGVVVHRGRAVGRVVEVVHVGNERLHELRLLLERDAVAELDPDDGAVLLQGAGEAGDDSGVPCQLDRHEVDCLACAVTVDPARHVDVAVGIAEGAGECELT